jgi:hypothetical protein
MIFVFEVLGCLAAEVDKGTFKSNSVEVLSDESLFKSNGDEALSEDNL